MFKNVLIIVLTIISIGSVGYNYQKSQYYLKKIQMISYYKQEAVKQLLDTRDKNEYLLKIINKLDFNNNNYNGFYIKTADKNKIFSWCLKKSKNSVTPSELHKIINEAFKYDNPLLIISIIEFESNFDLHAVSKKHADGLMQIMWTVWKDELITQFNIKTERELFEIDNNIRAGHYIFSKYYKQTGSVKKALNRYVGGDPTYPVRVLANYNKLKSLL